MLDDLLAGRVLHVSATADNKVYSRENDAWHDVTLPSPRGIAFIQANGRTAVACADGVHTFAASGERRTTLHIADLAIHEMVMAGQRLVVTAAGANKLLFITADGETSDSWTPPIAHMWINGLAAHHDQAAYVTALGGGNGSGWRARRGRGVLFRLDTNEVILDDLLLPHSPRMHQNKLYFLNSGTGELWSDGVPVMKVTGFARGLCFLDDTRAVIGVSQGRVTAFPDLTVDALAQPGLALVDVLTAQQMEFIPLDVQEIFDIQLGPAALVL